MQNVIHAAALKVIELHGENALLEAMNRIERYRAVGNNQYMATWNQIADAIEAFQMPQALTTDTIN